MGNNDDDLGSSATMAAVSEQPAQPAASSSPQTVVGHGAGIAKATAPAADAAPITGHDATMAAPSSPPAASQPGTAPATPARASTPVIRPSSPHLSTPGSTPPAVARAGGPRDYPELQPVDPRHFVPGKEIARGGMGRIIKARDRRLGRDVAIKELLVATGDLRARFEREARITAQLQHPAIVNIIEAGTWPTGEPFYVMKLVDGESLDKAIAARKTVAARLELLASMMTVVEALAYAHDKKIIHRDLKPANVLVGSFGEIVVIDWGLAKDLGAPLAPGASTTDFGGLYRDTREGETMAGSVMGTPSYMPAEQAKGEEVDERADVYALGAMLYHLLAGTAPYTGKTADAILARVIEGPPRPLAEVVDGVPSDLVTIVAKAMAYKPGDRYPTAKELADELHRFQTGQLVGAHRYTAGERLRRFARRYRVQLTAAAIAVVALAGVAGFSINRIVDERDVAVAARAEADAQRKLADDHRVRADTERGAAEDLVGVVLSDLEPALKRLRKLPLMKGVAKQVGDYYQKVTALEALDAKATAQRADALSALGDVFSDADEDADSKQSFEAAIAILNGQANSEVARARAQLGVVIAMTDLGDYKGAKALVDQGLTALDAAPAGPEVELARAKFERYRGILLVNQGKVADAMPSYTAAVDRMGRVIAKVPTDRRYRYELAGDHDRRCDARNALADRAGALEDAKAGLAIRQQLIAEDPGDLTTQYALILSWGKMFHTALSDHRVDDARKAAAEELAIAERMVALDPANVEWTLLMLGGAEHAGDVEYEDDHFDAAYTRVEHPIELAKELAARTDSLTVRDNYGNLLCHAADYENQANRPETLARADQLGHRCLEVEQALHASAPDNVDYYNGVGIAHERLGDTLSQRNQWEAAADEYRQRVVIDQELLRRDPTNARRKINVASIQFNTGLAVSHIPGHAAEAVGLMQSAVDALRELQSTGKLSRQFEVALPDYEKQLAAAKARK